MPAKPKLWRIRDGVFGYPDFAAATVELALVKYRAEVTRRLKKDKDRTPPQNIQPDSITLISVGWI